MKITLFVLVLLFCYAKSGTAQIQSDSSIYRSVLQMQTAFLLSDSAVRRLTIAEMQKAVSLDSLKNLQVALPERTVFTQRVIAQYEQNLKTILSSQQWVQYLQKKAIVRQRFLEATQSKYIPVQEIVIP